MSHHGSEGPSPWFDEFRKRAVDPEEMKKHIANMQERTGATGNFPHGSMGPGDEGEIAMAVGSDPDKGVVFIDFGKQVRWFGMEPAQVDGLCELLQKHKAAILSRAR